MASTFEHVERTLYSELPTDHAPSKAREAVMIVDDNAAVIDALVHVLGDRYDIIACGSYAEVDRQFRDTVKVVLLDIKMAPADGLMVYSLVKSRKDAVKVIWHTAYPGDSTVVQRMKDLRTEGWLLKGDYSIGDLVTAIDRAMTDKPLQG